MDGVLEQLIFIFRIGISCLCGIIIGYERKNRAKEAGIGTHCIVACTSAMMMIISKYGFYDVIGIVHDAGTARLDPSRMAQGIVTGVGFLGAGTIFIQRGSIKGLTTAAGIWATCGIGIAVGSGMYVIGIVTTLIVLVVQEILHSGNGHTISHKLKTLRMYNVNETGFQAKTTQYLERLDIIVTDVSLIKNDDGGYEYAFYIEMPRDMNEEEMVSRFGYRCSIDVTL